MATKQTNRKIGHICYCEDVQPKQQPHPRPASPTNTPSPLHLSPSGLLPDLLLLAALPGARVTAGCVARDHPEPGERGAKHNVYSGC